MKSKTDIIEDAIAKVNRRIERIGELFLSGEIDNSSYIRRSAIAEREKSELEQDLDEHLRREDIERNQSGNPDLYDVSGGRS